MKCVTGAGGVDYVDVGRGDGIGTPIGRPQAHSFCAKGHADCDAKAFVGDCQARVRIIGGGKFGQPGLAENGVIGPAFYSEIISVYRVS